MQSDGVKFYSVITGVVVVLVVILIFAIRGLTRTITVGEPQAETPVVETEPTPVSSDTVTETPTDTTPTTSQPTTPTADTDQELIDTLQAMADSKTIYKTGSKGAQVGALQTFLNKYNKTSTKVDNDFGPSLTAAIKAYQGKNGLPVTGQVAEKTLAKMIEWLKAN